MMKLFDTSIVPILLYGCEVWGFEDPEMIEVYHRSFLRKLLGVHRTAPNCMIYGETGRYPLKFQIKRRMIRFWLHTCKQSSKLSNAFCLTQERLGNLKWYSSIKETLIEAGIPVVYMYPDMAIPTDVINYLRHVHVNLAAQEWQISMDNNSLCQVYKTHKTQLVIEPYLQKLPKRHYVDLAKLRCANPKLPNVKNRFHLAETNYCPLCSAPNGNEYHLLLECEQFTYSRAEFLPFAYRQLPTLHKYKTLMCSSDPKLLKALSNFCGFIFSFLQ